MASPDIVGPGFDIQATKLYYTAAAALLVYDYGLTFSAEIECAWRSKKTPVSILFLLNRYCSLIFAAVTLTSYFSPLWTFPICNRYAIVQFVHTVFTNTIAEIFLTMRVNALTGRKKILTGLLVVHILAQLGLAVYTFSQSGSTAIKFSEPLGLGEFQICMLFPNGAVLKPDTAYLCLALSFDVVVFVLTLLVTFSTSRTHPTMRLTKVIQRDGIIYFFTIFSSTLVWTILLLVSRPGLKLMNAEPDLIFTTIMINRLFLSLKQAGKDHTVQRGDDFPLQVVVSYHIHSETRHEDNLDPSMLAER